MKKNTLNIVAEDQKELVASLPVLTVDDNSLPEFRATVLGMIKALFPSEKIYGERVTFKGKDTELSVLVYRPEDYQHGEELPGIYYIHGGGYVLGTADMYDYKHQQRANSLRAIIVAIEYRIAPEYPFPTPLMDCVDGLQWFIQNAASLGVPSDRISIMGESAGGGLAAALTLYVTDKKIYQPKNQILIYPMLDYRTSTEAQPVKNEYSGYFFWTDALNKYAWEKYRGKHQIADADFHYFSPSLAKDLSHLPPTYLMAGSIDLFFDEDMDYAWRIAKAGIPLNLEIVSGGIHAFDSLPGATAERYNANLNATLKLLL